MLGILGATITGETKGVGKIVSGRSRSRASGKGSPLPGSPLSFISLPHPHSFLIGEDGLVYEGRGWKIKGDHSGRTWNPRSIGITFMGNYMGE